MRHKALQGFFSEVQFVPSALQGSYFPSLDGLRGIAIIMVVLSHLHLTSRFYYNIIFNGELGVLIFFVLSGFLITTLCIKEKVITKNISLKNFYMRRALRIFPVAYLYLTVLILLNLVFKINVNYISILGAALYLTDISSYFRKYNFSWDTGHYWSLAVEEQFYLIIPFVLKKRFKVYLLILLFIVFVLPLFIWLQYAVPPLNNIILYAVTHFLIKFQAIAVGCLFSVLLFKYNFNNAIIVKTKLITNSVAIFLALIMEYDNFFTIKSMFSGLAISILTGYVIITNIVPGKDLIFKFLNLKILKTAGVLSYSIYIWQQVFVSNDKRLPGFMTTYPYNIICIVLVSGLSYYFYESFFLRLKSKFSKIPKKQPASVYMVDSI